MDSQIVYRGYTPAIAPENGAWNGRIAGIQAIETFEGATYEEAVEDFKRAVDFYLETEANPEIPFSGYITLQVTPEMHAALFRQAQNAGTTAFDAWLVLKLQDAVL